MHKAAAQFFIVQIYLKTSIVPKFVITLAAGLVTIFVIDPLDPTTVSAPFCLGIILMALSLRQSTSLVVAVSGLYGILTVYALIESHRYHEAHSYVGPHPYFWLFQRMGLFIVLCGMAIYLAYFRTDTERTLTRLRTILSKLPAPVILSDASGHIVYASDAVTPDLHQNPSPVIGRSYSDIVMTEKMKGDAIRSYSELFEAETNGIYQVEISPFGPANKMNAQIICLGTGRNRTMVTVLQNSEETSIGLVSPETSPPTVIRV